MRRDIRVKRWIESLGSAMTLLGLGGLGGAADGHGSMIIATAFFVIGFSIVLWGYQK